ncbi:MAG: aminotransferase class V-fold PLP-dependent enzyme, partial [Chlamydiae bacterium]|nr:aminotransferase class V-fold PLP-dependent enzyme [Chlamydiota bacterium]
QNNLPLFTSKKKVYDLLGAAENDGLYLSSNGPEAVFQVFYSAYVNHVKETGRTHFLATDMEDATILYSLKRMEKFGCSSKVIPVNQYGQLTKEILEQNLRPRSAMMSISWANNLTGVIHPLEDIAEVCKSKQVLLHVDCSSIIGKSYFRYEDMQVDFLTFDGSLFHDPLGSGAVVSKWSLPFTPFNPCPGFESVSKMLSLAETLEIASENFDHVCTETARLRDRLEKNVKDQIGDVVIPFAEVHRLPNVSVMCFPGVFNESLLYLLNSQGVYASMGGGKYQKISHILHLCQFDKNISQSALSFCLSHETTQQQVDKASQIIVDCYKKLIKCSISLKQEEKNES